MDICYSCGGDIAVIKDRPYHYDECGLKVIIHGITQYDCLACGETYASIPNTQRLHLLIGSHICEKRKALLRPDEILFLRKDLHLRAKELAKILGASPQAVSRWENGKKPIGETHDRLLRALYMMYASEQANHVICQGALDIFSELPAKSERKTITETEEIVLNPQEWLSDTGDCCSI
jgi:putative zinc finger/helix-turn-helix YgiT family protein